MNYNAILNEILSISRQSVEFAEKTNYIYFWYYTYYINSLFNTNLTDKLYTQIFEKYNIITLNLKKKQLRLTILTQKNKVLNLTVGLVLATLNILDKSKKKTNKGERLFIEYLSNFFKNVSKFTNINSPTILKIIYSRPKSKIHSNIIKLLNNNFLISKIIFDFKIANNYTKLKKIRSIKKRIKKKIIKLDSIINL